MELRLRPVTEAHDYAVKLKQAQAFLSKVSLCLGGRAAASSGTRGEVEEAVEPLREAAALEQAWAGALSRQAAARGDYGRPGSCRVVSGELTTAHCCLPTPREPR